MGMLQRFESRLEQAVSGAFAKAFRSAVQPVELAAALQREVDNSAQILSRNRRLVPNTFTIELSPVDHDRLQPYSQTLTDELVEMLREHAEEQHYVFAGPVAIDFAQEADLVTGRFRVRSQATAQVTPNASRGRPSSAGAAPGEWSAAIEVNGTRHPLTPPGLVIGRGAEADLRINDPGVSRRHAEFRVTGGRGGATEVSVADLGSTNGTLVDGQRVSEARLQDGSVVRVGSTDVAVRLGQRPGRDEG
jgi:hypothetical protein